MFCYTEPEFSVDVSKSSGIVGPITIEIFAAILSTLKHLQYCQMHLTALSHCVADYIQALVGRPPQYAPAPLFRLWAPKRLAPPSTARLQSADCNVTVGSHGQYVPTLTAAAA